MTTILAGTIRRIAYNPFNTNALNLSPTVVFYLEGDSTTYTIGSIAKGFAEAVLLSKPGDEIEAKMRKPEFRFATGLVVASWVNKTFEAEQASLTKAAGAQNGKIPGSDDTSAT